MRGIVLKMALKHRAHQKETAALSLESGMSSGPANTAIRGA